MTLRQSGLGKFEFFVILVIFGVLAHFLLDRLVMLEHETEQLEVMLTVRNVNLGLKLAVGERIMRGEEARIPELLARNPLEFLDQQKVGAGETAGGWQYDAGNRILSYRPRQPAAFAGQQELRWQFSASPAPDGRFVDLHLRPLK